MKKYLDAIFLPGSVAIIGASNRPGSIGTSVWQNMLAGGYKGRVFPVNLKYKSLDGHKVYRSLASIPEVVDLVVVTTPAATVADIIKEAGKKGVPGMVIVSAGFKESGKQGQRLFDKIQKLAFQHKIRIIGPNCVGVIHPPTGLNASFARRQALPGKLALISQSGAICTSILDWAYDQRVGFSHFISVGSMVDVSYHDLIDYLAMDRSTSAILIYMESLDDARKFMSAARAFSRNKPIIVLKAGKSTEGAQAALSHTGSLAGNDAVFDAAFQRAGIIRVNTIQDLFDCAQALAMQPLPQGKRLAVITNAGGPAILATDFLISNGGRLAELSAATVQALNGNLSPAWSKGNPVDVLGDGSPAQLQFALETVSRDAGVDAVLVIFTTQGVVDASEAAQAIVDADVDTSGKPMLASWMGEQDVADAREILEEARIPNYRYPENAVNVFLKMHSYKRNLELLYETPPSAPFDFKPDRKRANAIMKAAVRSGQSTLSEAHGAQLLECYDIPVLPMKLARDEEEAVEFGQEIGFPLVMKVSGPGLIHKTELGGVKLPIKHPNQVKKAFRDIVESVRSHKPDAEIDGVLLLPYIKKRHELLLGSKTDEIFGPVLVFGMGGVAVEVFRDQVIGLPPLNMILARRLIEQTKIYTLLKGYRNMPGVDLDSIYFLLIRFGYLVVDYPEIREMDINPFAVDEHGGVVLDVKIVLHEEGAKLPASSYYHPVIPPYPEQYNTTVKLKDETTVQLRPIRPEDEPLEARMFDYLSKETIYFRFFGYIPKPEHKNMTRFTHIDYDREMAIIATQKSTSGKEEMMGVVRIIGDPWGQVAEYAIVVADPYQRKGLGSILTGYILDIAREKGYKKVYASLLKSNTGMKVLFEKFGFTIRKEDPTTFYAEKKIQPGPAS
jgi:acetyltransferase